MMGSTFGATTMQRRRLGQLRNSLPEPCKLATGKNIYQDGEFKAMNHQWESYLTRWVNKPGIGAVCIGRDPKTVKPEILTMAGHPPRSATQRIKTYMLDMDFDLVPKRDQGLARVRELCMECAYNVQAIKECNTIQCPLWALRFGNNPHTYHKNQSRKDD